MGEKTIPQIYVQELRVPSQSSFGTQRPIVGRHDSSAPQGLWPTQPRILKETKLSKWVNYAYDTVLCVAPIFLMIKICLTIYASTGELANADAPLTGFLTNFNRQVREAPENLA